MRASTLVCPFDLASCNKQAISLAAFILRFSSNSTIMFKAPSVNVTKGACIFYYIKIRKKFLTAKPQSMEHIKEEEDDSGEIMPTSERTQDSALKRRQRANNIEVIILKQRGIVWDMAIGGSLLFLLGTWILQLF